MKAAPAHALHEPYFFRSTPPIYAHIPAAYETRIHDTIATIDRQAWNALYSDTLERYDYLHAVEDAGIPGFEWFYLTVHRYDRLAAAAPCFVTTYDLETTLNERVRNLIAKIRLRYPSAFKLRLAAIGSPCTETAMMHIAGGLTENDRRHVSSLLVKALRSEARRRGAGVRPVSRRPSRPCDRPRTPAPGCPGHPGAAGSAA